MVERGTISIEPYQQTGIMGQEIDLNEPVVQRFVVATDFVRDVVISKESKREKTGVDNLGNTLAFKKMAIPTFDFHPTPTYSLTRTGTTFLIGVDDENLRQKADEEMKKKYKKDPNINGQDVFKQRFVANLNHTVKEALKKSLTLEKLDLKERYGNWMFNLAIPSLIAYSLAEGNTSSATIDTSLFLLLTAFTNFYARTLRERGFRNNTFRFENNVMLPTLPVDSYVRGRLFLAINGHRLVTSEKLGNAVD